MAVYIPKTKSSRLCMNISSCYTMEKYLDRGCSALSGIVFVYGWGSPCEMRFLAVKSEHCYFGHVNETTLFLPYKLPHRHVTKIQLSLLQNNYIEVGNIVHIYVYIYVSQSSNLIFTPAPLRHICTFSLGKLVQDKISQIQLTARPSISCAANSYILVNNTQQPSFCSEKSFCTNTVEMSGCMLDITLYNTQTHL